MNSRDSVQRPHAFLSLTDFHVLLSVLEGYLQLLRQQNQDSTQCQKLYTKMEIAVFTMHSSKPETLDLTHDELVLLWKALGAVDYALRHPIGDDALEQFRSVAEEQLVQIQSSLLTALVQANRGQHRRVHD